MLIEQLCGEQIVAYLQTSLLLTSNLFIPPVNVQVYQNYL